MVLETSLGAVASAVVQIYTAVVGSPIGVDIGAAGDTGGDMVHWLSKKDLVSWVHLGPPQLLVVCELVCSLAFVDRVAVQGSVLLIYQDRHQLVGPWSHIPLQPGACRRLFFYQSLCQTGLELEFLWTTGVPSTSL